jgi:uncharacterized OB-fold protein
MTQTKTVATSSDSCYSQEGTAIMTSTCKKCGGKKVESDAICNYCHKSQERHSINQVVGRKAAIIPCKKCGGNKAESDAICNYCHKAEEDPNINQAVMLKLRNRGTNRGRHYPRP